MRLIPSESLRHRGLASAVKDGHGELRHAGAAFGVVAARADDRAQADVLDLYVVAVAAADLRLKEERADAEYPNVEEMRNAWKQVSAELSAALSLAPPEVLTKDAPKGPPSFDGKVSGTVAFFAFHDTYHTGQVSYLRKWLGYGQAVG